MSMKTFFRLVRNNITFNPLHLFFLLRHAITLLLLRLETKRQFTETYGNFNFGRDLREYGLNNFTSEGGAILGDVVYFARSVDLGNGKVLFAGDRNDVKTVWSPYFSPDQMITCGIHEMDHYWDFEEKIPQSLSLLSFRLIISQAMIEHLVDPFNHFADLVSLLTPGGILIIHSVLPGFFYHRVPIDCQRFYPDWFETCASRFGMNIIDRQISVFHITYKMEKPPC